MDLPKIDFSKYPQPLKLLLTGNTDTWYSMLAVIEDLTAEQLVYKPSNYAQRNIAEMVNHAVNTQHSFYTQQLVLGQPYADLFGKLPVTVAEAQEQIVKAFTQTTKLWQGLKHVSEICFLRGLGGFPTKAMG